MTAPHDPAACEPPGRLTRCRCLCPRCERIRREVDAYAARLSKP